MQCTFHIGKFIHKESAKQRKRERRKTVKISYDVFSDEGVVTQFVSNCLHDSNVRSKIPFEFFSL